GETKAENRLAMVEAFNEDTTPIFLISLKAGGTGLNLTGADIVIHYDPWWNVSSENQATDRAYRIGQEKNVQVFKLITQNTIEEKIKELQERKTGLADNVLTEGHTLIGQMNEDEIRDLFTLD
ncbi:MAG: C-terminal helicase domain-containing protein, partial [Niameybacter sp.]